MYIRAYHCKYYNEIYRVQYKYNQVSVTSTTQLHRPYRPTVVNIYNYVHVFAVPVGKSRNLPFYIPHPEIQSYIIYTKYYSLRTKRVLF